MYSKNPQIIYVTGEEAKLIELANHIDREAELRTQRQDKPGAMMPFIFYIGEDEKAIMKQKNMLVEKYRRELGLEISPILAPQPMMQFDMLPARNFVGELQGIRRRPSVPTDLELAAILLHKIILRRQGETLYLFEGKYYKRLTTSEVKTLILEHLRDELNIGGTAKQIESVYKVLLAEPEIRVPDMPACEYCVCLLDGIFDLQSGSMLPFSSQMFLTYQMQVHWQGKQPCPTFERFLYTVTGGDQLLALRFCEALGYVLSPDCSAKRFLLLQGHGDTGKSVLGNLIRSFFTEDVVGSVDMFKMGDRFSLASIADKCVNISMDLSNSALNEQAVAIIKQITGSDAVQVEEKYKAPYSAYIRCKLIFGTNHALKLNSLDHAFTHRVLLLPFHYPVPKEQQDHWLLEKLKAERSGIFYKAMQAFSMVIKRNYVFTGDECYTASQAQAIGESTTNLVNSVELFVDACCMESENSFVPTKTLHQHYSAFCQAQNIPCISETQNFSRQFNLVASERFPHMINKKERVPEEGPVNGYRGIALCTMT